MLKVLEEVDVKGISHITGGGFYENIPRSLKKGCCARIHKADVRTPALFHLMQKEGGISEHDMFNTFNMGVGMVLTVLPSRPTRRWRSCMPTVSRRLTVWASRRRRGCGAVLNIAVLVSGGGTNLQALLDSEARGENPNGKITLVVASKPGVYALERAAKAGVESCVVRRKDYDNSEDFERPCWAR